jgi:release factor glutamine methyltransferase
MQNKANFRKTKMNVSSVLTKDYERNDAFAVRKNKPNTNPIKANTKPIKPKTKPIQTQYKAKQSQFQTRCILCEFFLFFTFLGASYNLAMQTWTIQKLLNWITEHFTKKGIDSPRLSAELLLSCVLAMKRIELYTQFDKAVDKQQLDRLHELVERAGRNEPVAYLTGKTEFYSLELNITPDCMIPRPETELLVERAIEFLRTRPGKQFVCDLCTGCGCIAVAIAKNSPEATIIATDISDTALNIAAGNVEKHQLKDRIRLLCGDLFDAFVPPLDVDKFDLIVCNPPYVSAAEFEKLDKNIKDYEPRLALFAGDDGLDVYRRIIDKADQFLRPDGALMLEIGFTQGRAIKELLEQAGTFTEIKIEKDHHDNDRIAIARKLP